MMFFLVFFHIRHFTLLCLPKGCLLRSNRLSLKKSLEKATEDIKATLERAAVERDVIYLISLSTRRAGAEQAQSTAADLMADASAAGPFLGGWEAG